ncbi:phosphate uptake regulator PhoU [Candidatus Woesearchaeota archaeon]|nr:phosphate uptake regulator PhoU [Candidatus Woesearchaeota archaeon]
MEYRKLISFGKSSFVVSLPKAWLVQNKLKKGDLLYLEENGPNLMLSKSTTKDEEEEKTKVINIDGKDLLLITREVNSAYILNYRTVILKGRELKNKVKEIQQLFQNLIALEVMEQASNSVIARDFLNMEQVSIEELIHKMDIIARTMLKETISSISKDNYENINERDRDVNRLYFLLYRTVLYNLEHLSHALKKYGLGPVDLLNKHLVGRYIELIADEARRTARFSRLIKGNAKNKAALISCLGKVEQYYIETMKAHYANDVELALKLSCSKEEFIKELDAIDYKSQEISFVTATSRVRRLISHIHCLGQVTYTRSNY